MIVPLIVINALVTLAQAVTYGVDMNVMHTIAQNLGSSIRGWTPDVHSDPCSPPWQGVICTPGYNNLAYVTHIQLNNSLSGVVNLTAFDSVSQLSMLQLLDLSINLIKGIILDRSALTFPSYNSLQ